MFSECCRNVINETLQPDLLTTVSIFIEHSNNIVKQTITTRGFLLWTQLMFIKLAQYLLNVLITFCSKLLLQRMFSEGCKNIIFETLQSDRIEY